MFVGQGQRTYEPKELEMLARERLKSLTRHSRLDKGEEKVGRKTHVETWKKKKGNV